MAEDMLETGQPAPAVRLPADGGDELDLKDFAGKIVVLFFYPKDDTSGCTKEAVGFSERVEEFNAAGAEVIGLSKDSVKSHDKFKAKHDLKIRLLSDEDCSTCARFGVWVEKSMYGRKYMGIERSTFLIDRTGTIRKVWRKVKVPGHVDAVLEAVKLLDT
ncbi:thioredoxin-dependent thiol peroxidase [Amaricoccus macauensis]|uniref:thioredoxin-dependent thiol peroxidase n=1 Tax=Amaricoccus macauensis TaxID=57001 RepID=UPI003C7E74D6